MRTRPHWIIMKRAANGRVIRATGLGFATPGEAEAHLAKNRGLFGLTAFVPEQPKKRTFRG